jgi:cytochrome oxidase Cu insertion factor (SCO1/SenC/PrrC family)
MRLAVATVAAVGFLAIGLATFLIASSSPSGSVAGDFVGSMPPGSIAIPTFRLSDYDGTRVASEDLRGKVVVLTFLDTKCTDVCPFIARDVAAAWRLLTLEERRQTLVVAISSDPRDDTPASIRAFLRRHRALGTFRYLAGRLSEMKRVWSSFQILSSFESGDAATHSAPVRIYSRDGIWLATLHAGADLTPPNLVHDVRVALVRGE